MANKEFTLDNGLAVTVYKRRGGRNLRLSVNAHGQVRVSIPAWAPYKAGVDFAKSRQDWIVSQHRQPNLLASGQAVGKAHHLVIEAREVARPTGKLLGSNVLVRHPYDMSPDDPEVQKTARETAVKALRKQAEQLLPQRLAMLAAKHGFDYKDVTVKRLKGRWGSCDQDSNIVLNLFLMQLPWKLIDYVLLHELTHTRIMRHGPDFWGEMQKLIPDIKEVRRQMREHHPVLNG